MLQRIDRRKRPSTCSTRKRKTKSAIQLFEQTNPIDLKSKQWLLPETEDYLRTNDKKQHNVSVVANEEEAQEQESIKRLPSAYAQVKSYLKTNSLVAKGLTIFDVLYPVSVTVKEPQHVQVIDRYVLAKVWDDILPLTYGSYVNKFRLVNHYAVNLEDYEMKLNSLIEDYYE
ncbi:unnamed protein product [Rotaria magnacalcarata]|nr:unnamed protein product [Rotaria magnacalcarata]